MSRSSLCLTHSVFATFETFIAPSGPCWRPCLGPTCALSASVLADDVFVLLSISAFAMFVLCSLSVLILLPSAPRFTSLRIYAPSPLPFEPTDASAPVFPISRRPHSQRPRLPIFPSTACSSVPEPFRPLRLRGPVIFPDCDCIL